MTATFWLPRARKAVRVQRAATFSHTRIVATDDSVLLEKFCRAHAAYANASLACRAFTTVPQNDWNDDAPRRTLNKRRATRVSAAFTWALPRRL